MSSEELPGTLSAPKSLRPGRSIISAMKVFAEIYVMTKGGPLNSTKTIVYYKDNYRVGSKDLFYSENDIKNAKTLKDLGIDLDLYWDENFKHGKIVFNESIIADDDIKAFIDAPSPIVVYEKLS